MEENKNKEINTTPAYIPEPLIEFIPTDLSTIDFSKYVKPWTKPEPEIKPINKRDAAGPSSICSMFF